MEKELKPLILDFSEQVENPFAKDGEQVNYGATSFGTWDDPDSGGTD